MRHSLARLLVVLSALLALVAAWTKEDHEIFRLRDEVQQTEGLNVTFYDFLGVKPTVSQADLLKAFRKKSKQLHPDKAKRTFIASYTTNNRQKPGVRVSKGPSEREIAHALRLATERYARLGVVHNILKGPERERYDHFLHNGFPKWKGTGYYYSRFRPGLGSVLFGLFVTFGGAAHYGALVLSWKRQREFVDRYIRHARRAAWGDELGVKGIAGLGELNGSAAASGAGSGADPGDGAVAMNRRQKRMMDKENRKDGKKKGRSSGNATPNGEGVIGYRGDRKRVMAENGKVLIVDAGGKVFLEEENEDGVTEEFLLDVDEIPRPGLRDTFAVKFPLWAYRRTLGRFLGAGEADSADGNVAEGGREDGVDTDADVSVVGGSQKRPNNSGSRKKGKKG
ncbi:DnaJ domain-containing protein [Histoplasma ohiense]|nr:DnaJ domain-containing protein [Histoplasma ohiense (nom. inval.)]